MPGQPQTASAPSPGPRESPAVDALYARTFLAAAIQTCNVLFATISIMLALLGTWLHLLGEARLSTVVCLWLMPLVDAVWNAVTRRYDRVKADLLRGLVCLPLAAVLYVAEGGALEKLWLPALLMAVSIGFSLGLASRPRLGCLVALAYASTLFVAATVTGDDSLGMYNDALGVALTGCLIAIVSNQLAHTLREAREQRDAASAQKDRAESALRQLTAVIETLHVEMATRMRVEIELRHAQKLESVGRLAAGVAHEINTPVQFVSDSLQFVRDGVTELCDVVDRFEREHRSPLAAFAAVASDADLPYLMTQMPKAVVRALEGLDRVSTIVRSMKDFAHPDGREMSTADLNRAVSSTLTIARNEYKYVADLETEFGDLPPIRCHVGELNQAVLNIVINAAHAIGDVVRGTDRKGRIQVRTYRDGDQVVIAIADSGPGISDPVREHLFEPFFTTKPVGQGTGQGLAIARSVVVDKHRGRLDFETALGHGTTFFIRLPIGDEAGSDAVGCTDAA